MNVAGSENSLCLLAGEEDGEMECVGLVGFVGSNDEVAHLERLRSLLVLVQKAGVTRGARLARMMELRARDWAL